MAKIGRKLTPNKMKAIAALLESPTITSAAEVAGVGHRTITRWMAEDEVFKQALLEAQTRALDQTIARLSGAGPRAADILFEIANDASQPPSIRVQAASKILAEQRAGLSLVTLKNDLDDLRRIINEHEK